MVPRSGARQVRAHRVGCGVLALASLGALALPSGAFAQATEPVPRPAPSSAMPAMPVPASSPVFVIRGFKVTGDDPLPDGDTTRVLAPFLRADATIETLQEATAALEAALKERGFGLHRVALPPQEVGDTVTLHVLRFSVARVSLEGRSLYGDANIRRSLPELRVGGTPNFKRLAVQAAIANENPNKQVQVVLRESAQPDKIDATIVVKEDKPWNVAASVSNAGSEATGRDRFTLTGSHSNVLDLDHQFIGAYTTSLQRASDVRQLGVSYKVPLYAQGVVIGASYTRSDVVGTFGAFSSTGAGHTLGLAATKYLPPEGGRRSYVSLGLDDRVFKATTVNGLAAGVDRRSRPLSLGYNARTESDTSVWGYDVQLAVNTASGAGNDLASYRNENTRIDTVHWKAVRGSASYAAPLPGAWLLSARGSYQYSPDVLIAGEQFGLGGLGSVRGTGIDRPITGDHGVQGTVEVSTRELAPGLRLLGFVDAGWLGNNSPADLQGRPSSDSIASVGFGVRHAFRFVALSADYGRIVTGSKVPLAVNPNAPKRGEHRFYVNASVRF